MLEALQEERKRHPDAQILVAAMNDWGWDGQTTVRRAWQIEYEPFLYWEGGRFYDDMDDCLNDLMDSLGIAEEEAERHIERNGYEEAIVIYAY